MSQNTATLSSNGHAPAPDILNESKALQTQILARLSDKDDTLGQAYDARLTRRLLSYLAPYRHYVILAIVFQTIQAAASVAGPPIISRAIDQGILPGDV